MHEPTSQQSPDYDQVTIRLARPGDTSAILEISNWAIRNTAANFRSEPETEAEWAEQHRAHGRTHPVFVAEADGSVAGFAKASPFHSR